MKRLSEYIVKEDVTINESLNLSELYNYIKDNYESKAMERLKFYDKELLMIPMYYEAKTTTIAHFSVIQSNETYVNSCMLLDKKLSSCNEKEYNLLMKNIEEATKNNKITNEFIISILDKMINILGKDSLIQKK